MSNYLQPPGLQHTGHLCSPLSPRVCSNSYPLSRLAISSSADYSFSLQSFPASADSSNESALHIRRANYRSFSISPFNECWGLISFRIDWFDLLAVQRTLKSLLQHHNTKASILQHSAFFMVQLSHLYMTTGKA